MSGNWSKSAFFEGVGHFECRFQREGGIAHQPLLVSKNRVIAVSCGMKISTVLYLVLSQYMRLTDRLTALRQQYRALHYMQSHGKND